MLVGSFVYAAAGKESLTWAGLSGTFHSLGASRNSEMLMMSIVANSSPPFNTKASAALGALCGCGHGQAPGRA